jgi:hypothetical protein
MFAYLAHTDGWATLKKRPHARLSTERCAQLNKHEVLEALSYYKRNTNKNIDIQNIGVQIAIACDRLDRMALGVTFGLWGQLRFVIWR